MIPIIPGIAIGFLVGTASTYFAHKRSTKNLVEKFKDQLEKIVTKEQENHQTIVIAQADVIHEKTMRIEEVERRNQLQQEIIKQREETIDKLKPVGLITVNDPIEEGTKIRVIETLEQTKEEIPAIEISSSEILPIKENMIEKITPVETSPSVESVESTSQSKTVSTTKKKSSAVVQ